MFVVIRSVVNSKTEFIFNKKKTEVQRLLQSWLQRVFLFQSNIFACQQARPYFFSKQRACLLATTFRLAIPVFLTLTEVTDFMTGIKYYIDGECRKKIKIV